MDQSTLKKSKELIKLNNENICDCCLGRKFSNVLKIEENENKKNENKEIINKNRERGKLIKEELPKEGYDFETKQPCEICDDILLKIYNNNKNGNILKKNS